MKKESKDLREEMDHTLQAVPEIDIIHKLRIGLVDMEHGKNRDGDYIWHFMPVDHRVKFPDDLTFIYSVLKGELDRIIPDGHRVDVYPPEKNWEIKVISVVARKIGKWWSFDSEDMKKPLHSIATRISNATSSGGKVMPI